MGYISPLRKQFKSMNTYDFIITLIKRGRNPLSTFKKLNGSLFEETWIPFTQICFVQNLVEISIVVPEKKMKKFTTTPTTTMMTDNGQILIRKTHLSLRLRWAKNPIPHLFNLFQFPSTNLNFQFITFSWVRLFCLAEQLSDVIAHCEIQNCKHGFLTIRQK